MTFGNNPREYPDEWKQHLAEHPGAQPVFIHKRIVGEPEAAEHQLKSLVAQRAKQTKAELKILTPQAEELPDGWAMLIAQKPRKGW